MIFPTIETFPGTYSTIKYEIESDDSLAVQIFTANLILKSVTVSDFDYYAVLFHNSKVMKNIESGKAISIYETALKIHNWTDLWVKRNPFSAFAIYNKESKFVGHAALEKESTSEEAKISLIFKQFEWKKGYGTEVAEALVYDYAPLLVKQGHSLNKITAVIRDVDTASRKILKKLAFEKAKEKKGEFTQFHYYSKSLT